MRFSYLSPVATTVLATLAMAITSCHGSRQESAQDGGPPPVVENPSITPSVLPPSGLVRLTARQVSNSIRDIFGTEVAVTPDPTVDTVRSGYLSIGARQAPFSDLAIESMDATASAAASLIVKDSTKLTHLVGCDPSKAGVTCLSNFLTQTARRVFRRPLSDVELARYQGLISAAQSGGATETTAIEYALTAMLESPFFLYRSELGSGSDNTPVSSYEMASKLSYLVWQSTPDDQLLDLAERDGLVSDTDITSEVDRMLKDPRAIPSIRDIFSEIFEVQHIDTLGKDPTTYPSFNAELALSMRHEIEWMFDDRIFIHEADFLDILTTRRTFVDAPLAQLYDLNGALGATQAMHAVDLPNTSPRMGILGTAGMLALRGRQVNTSPTLRGKFLRERLLCQNVPDPPPGVVARLSDSSATGLQTMRQKLEQHRSSPTCAGCHVQMDPLGLPQEHFDAIGAFRDTDHGLDIDASGNLEAVTFDGLAGLATALRADPRLPKCLVQQIFRATLGEIEPPANDGTLEAFAGRFTLHEHRIIPFLREFVLSNHFRYVGPPRTL